MAWIFKASSTIDSMLGYKEGKLKWLGFTGAKLDDLMVWLPSRIVLITLPFLLQNKAVNFQNNKKILGRMELLTLRQTQEFLKQFLLIVPK